MAQLTLAMRTPGGEVTRGRWRRSLSGGGLSESFSADGVAVLVCCTASGPAGETMWHELPIFREQSYPAVTSYDAAERTDMGAYRA